LLSKRDSAPPDRPWTETIWAVLKDNQPVILIEAGPSMGKTVLMDALAITAAHEPQRGFIPGRAKARALLDRDIGQALFHQIQEQMAVGTRHWLDASLFRFATSNNAEWLVLIDDVDELAYDEDDRRAEFIQKVCLAAAMQTEVRMRFVMTTRPLPRGMVANPKIVGEYRLLPFGPKQTSDYEH